MTKRTKFNKKLLSALLAVLMLAVSLPLAGITAFAGRYGDDFDYFMRENDNIAIRYLGDKSSVIVPSELDGYAVTELAAEAFIYKENLTAVTIPDSITLISNYAFIGSDNLKDIYYGGSEKQWNEITIDPDNNGPLFNATIHYNYEGPYFTPTISDMMKSDIFSYRYSLEDGTAELYGCYVGEPEEGNTDVIIPSELDGHTLTVIGVCAFSSSAIKKVTIPDTVASIGEGAFSQCFYLENITIPESITSIGKQAFECCNFTEISIPKGVTSIEDSAFLACVNLASVTLSNGVTNISRSAFYGCNSLTDVYFNGTEEEWNAITIEENNEPLINATIHFNPVEEPTDQTKDDASTDTDNPSSSPAIDPVIIIVIAIAIAVIGAAVVVIVVVKKKKIK